MVESAEFLPRNLTAEPKSNSIRGRSTSREFVDRDRGESDTIWREALATRAHVVVDAADYFDLLR